MARTAAAAARSAPTRSKPRTGAAARSKPRPAAPARESGHARPKAPARHASRRRPAGRARTAAQRRVSGAAGAPAVALPVRVLNAPFARAARRRTGGVLDALLSGRGWIALVFVLLAGIVFFNVDLLQMNRDIARNAEKISTLKRDIARNRLDVARLASSERIQESAAALGLVLPAPGEVRYLKARPTLDPQNAAKRITAPNLGYVPPAPVDTAPAPPATDPVATDPAATPTHTDPTAADPAYTDPAAADPAHAHPAATAPETTTPAG